jgi:hypothetical protein
MKIENSTSNVQKTREERVQPYFSIRKLQYYDARRDLPIRRIILRFKARGGVVIEGWGNAGMSDPDITARTRAESFNNGELDFSFSESGTYHDRQEYNNFAG